MSRWDNVNIGMGQKSKRELTVDQMVEKWSTVTSLLFSCPVRQHQSWGRRWSQRGSHWEGAKSLKSFWGRTQIDFSEKIQWKCRLICYCIGVSSDSGVFIYYCSGETSGGAGFPVHGRSLKVLLHQQRGGRPNHISFKKNSKFSSS